MDSFISFSEKEQASLSTNVKCSAARFLDLYKVRTSIVQNALKKLFISLINILNENNS